MRFGGANKSFALGRLKTGEMNRLEKSYAEHLDLLLHKGDVVWWKFEAVKLRLADNTFLSPDFFVMLPSGELEAHETKGFMTEDANVKLKVAAAMFPFRFYLIRAVSKKAGGGFSIVEV